MSTVYRVMASKLHVHPAPRVKSPILIGIPSGWSLLTDSVTVGDYVIGYDDPSTPEPARQTDAWVHVQQVLIPDQLPRPLVGFASLAWLRRTLDDPVTPMTLTPIHAPRISRALFVDVLTRARSAAAPEAGACYDVAAASGCDPAVALAFFYHESKFGRDGIAARTRNWGNLRHSPGGLGHEVPGANGGMFVAYPDWVTGIRDWCILMHRPMYRGESVALILPDYAPSSDGNRPERYAAAVVAKVNEWMAEDLDRADHGGQR